MINPTSSKLRKIACSLKTFSYLVSIGFRESEWDQPDFVEPQVLTRYRAINYRTQDMLRLIGSSDISG